MPFPLGTAQQKPISRAAERRTSKQVQATMERLVYRAVDERDRWKCRACKGPADPRATDMLKHGHHHHIVFRSMGGNTTTQNVALVCNGCHADIHAYRLTIKGDANKTLKVTRC